MADTQRTLTAILALLADNTTGDISPQDLRDTIVSILGGYGAIYLHGGSTAQTSISATPAKVTGFASNGISSGTTPDHANDKITILTAGDYLVAGAVSFSGTLSKTFFVEIYKNSTGTEYAFERKLGTGGDVGAAPVGGLITLAVNDEISLYVSSSDGGTSFTPQEASLIVTRVG